VADEGSKAGLCRRSRLQRCQPAPVTVIPGVAFLGSWDGHIRAYETKTGAIIWDFDTVQDFQTVNGVKARGGSINSMAPVIAAECCTSLRAIPETRCREMCCWRFRWREIEGINQ